MLSSNCESKYCQCRPSTPPTERDETRRMAATKSNPVGAFKTRRLSTPRRRRDPRLQATAERAARPHRIPIQRRGCQRRRVGDWRYFGAMVATQLRDLHVPLPAGACHEAEGVQEAILCEVAQEQYVPFSVLLLFCSCHWGAGGSVSTLPVSILHLQQTAQFLATKGGFWG